MLAKRKINQFEEAKSRYEAAINIPHPIEYKSWIQLPDDQKAISLFLTYYDIIVNEAFKASYTELTDEDKLHAVNYILITRLVRNIKGNPEKYTCGYITISMRHAFSYFNRMRHDNGHRTNDCSIDAVISATAEIKPIAYSDIFVDKQDVLHDRAICKVHNLIFEHLDEFDTDTRRVIKCLVKNKPIPSSLKPKVLRVMTTLRELLAEPYSYISEGNIYCETFEDVAICEDLIAEATVLMSDGVEASYFGDKIVRKNNSVYYIFYSDNGEYQLSRKSAYGLKVLNVYTMDGSYFEFVKTK